MKRLAVAVAVTAALVGASTALASGGTNPANTDPPPPACCLEPHPTQASPLITVSKDQPRAGKAFSPFVVAVLNSSVRLIGVECRGRIGGKAIQGVPQSFFAGGTENPSAVACSYRIPRKTAGKRFTAWVSTTSESAGGVLHGDGVPHTWRIRAR